MRIVAYYRVSTRKQGQSGLGLEAQEAAVKAFALQNGGTIVSNYCEIESGKRKDRPELAAALAHAKMIGARLVIAKLDRLARNVAFTSALMEAGVDFVCCDNPHATRLTIHILAAVAEDEARRISDRTSSALAAAKVRGVKLGSARPGHWKGRETERLEGLSKARQASVAVRREQARQFPEFVLPRIEEQRAVGWSYAAIAEKLNSDGFTTRRGKQWSAMAVLRVCKAE